MELSPLAPSVFEIVVSLGVVVALVFGAYVIRQIATNRLPLRFGLTLMVLSFVVPFSGPLVLGALQVRRGMRERAYLDAL